jgi:hypothetical protein
VLTVGTYRRRQLSDAAICSLYQQGFSRVEIGWRAKLYDAEVTAILRANGVALRSSTEAQAMARARRLERERLRAKA